MQLNLNPILGLPGRKMSFDFELELPVMDFCTIHDVAKVQGTVVNSAGALTLTGSLEVSMTCLCDRCAVSFPIAHTMPVTAYLTETLTEDANPDAFPIKDGTVDLSDIFTTAFVLGFDRRLLCSEDCQGLCASCGTNKNDGACSCQKDVDPRLTALQQLLDTD